MPPKRNKSITPSGVTPTGAAAANKSWETALTAAVFDEVTYKLHQDTVTIVVVLFLFFYSPLCC